MKKALVILFLALPLAAQTSSIPCPPELQGGAVLKDDDVDQISSGNTGVLSGTLYTVSEQVSMPAGGPGKTPTCYPQWVRAYRDSAPANWNPSAQAPLLAIKPGPTLRANVGDVVNLTFLNSIDAAKFPLADEGCDETNVYPGTTGDKYPDCFGDSVYTNVHYHGTHTSPNNTADNVFINVRPSPRDPAKNNAPIIQASDVQSAFAQFFAQCNAELKPPITTPKVWPRRWKDLEVLKPIETNVATLLTGYVEKYGLPGWAASNKKLIENGFWPQYFVGAYPYCFSLPKWTGTTPSTAVASDQSPHSHGAGIAEDEQPEDTRRSLKMGQAPGTHWYHAHKHGSTTINVMNGMTGVFVIQGSYDQALKDYYKTSFVEKVLVLQQLGSVPNLVTNARGDVNFYVNGKYKPVLQMAGNSVQMWRIANTAGRAGAFFASPAKTDQQPDVLTWKQLAVDGVQLAPENYESRPSNFLLASGNRIDLLVKAPAYKAGGNNKYDVIVYNTVNPTDRPPIKPTAAQLVLMTVEVTANGPDMQLIPKDKLDPLPKFLDDVTEDEVTGTKIIRFASTKGTPQTQHTIDGKKFDGELGAVVELNRSEEWKVDNYTVDGAPPIAHPFHIHINPFQLTEIFDPNAYLAPSPKGAGTVSITSGTTGVTGVGTSFTKDFRVNDVILIDGGQGGVISAIGSDTSITLSNAGKATKTVNGVGYAPMIQMYTTSATDQRAGQCYLNPGDKKTWKPCGTAVKPEQDLHRVWWDVFPIPAGRSVPVAGQPEPTQIPGYFKMRSRFVDFPGYFVIHCHILAHEDRGMMTVVGIAPIQTPYSHH